MFKITVVITAFNLEKYLDQCFYELSIQTMQDFNILVVNDHSTDNTLPIIYKWKEVFTSRMELLNLDVNLGMPALTRNAALDSGRINGDYVIFLDGDDVLEAQFLENLYDGAVCHDADISICAYDRVDEKTGKVLATEMQQTSRLLFDHLMDGDGAAFINTAPWNKLWKRELIEDLRFPPFKVGEEVSFNFRAYEKSGRILLLPEVLIHYRVRADSVISNTDEETIWMFESELRTLYHSYADTKKDIVGLLVFIHSGLSMALRAAEIPDFDFGQYSKRMQRIFKQEYGWFRNNKFLKFRSLLRHGWKGFALWCALAAYRMHLFGAALKIYRLLGLHIRF